jgi:hypothetical protein
MLRHVFAARVTPMSIPQVIRPAIKSKRDGASEPMLVAVHQIAHKKLRAPSLVLLCFGSLAFAASAATAVIIR